MFCISVQRRYFRDLRPKVYVIKRSITLFGQCFYLNLIFREQHFRRLAIKLQNHVLVKISSTKISYGIYNICNRYLRNDGQSMFRKREGRGNNSCHFSDQYFLPCFLCKHPTILSQNKNGIFQHKN